MYDYSVKSAKDNLENVLNSLKNIKITKDTDPNDITPLWEYASGVNNYMKLYGGGDLTDPEFGLDRIWLRTTELIYVISIAAMAMSFIRLPEQETKRVFAFTSAEYARICQVTYSLKDGVFTPIRGVNGKRVNNYVIVGVTGANKMISNFKRMLSFEIKEYDRAIAQATQKKC